MQEEIFANHMILFSEEIVAILDYHIHNRIYIKDIWIQNMSLALIFANVYELEKFAKLKDW